MPFKVETLKYSFAEIKPQAAEVINSFYNNLFTDAPQLQLLFANTTMAMQRKPLKFSRLGQQLAE